MLSDIRIEDVQIESSLDITKYTAAPMKRSWRFIKGPIPMAWMSKAAKRPGKSGLVGLVLWYWAGIRRKKKFKFSVSRLEGDWGVTKYSGLRALNCLEAAGLIRIEKIKGKMSLVTILHSEPKQNLGSGGSPE